MYIDFHTHAFADKIAEKAIAGLSATSGIEPFTDGTLSGLKKRMKECGIAGSVLLPVATKPSQHGIVNSWAAEINNRDGIYAFGSVHPKGEDALEYLDKINELGLYGVKLHPDYQNFLTTDESIYPVYEKCAELGLPILFHAGYDPLSPDLIHGTAEGFRRIADTFPNLTMILAHLGGMYRWDRTERLLAGIKGNVYFDLAVIAGEIGEEQLMRIISKHGADRILFGSDCPWDNPQNEIDMVESLPITAGERELIFYKNAERILKI